MEPEFGYIYQVTIEKYRLKHGDAQTEEEVVFILAEDIDDAMDKGADYADSINQSKEWNFYEIVGVKRGESIFLGLQEDIEELEILPETGISAEAGILSGSLSFGWESEPEERTD